MRASQIGGWFYNIKLASKDGDGHVEIGSYGEGRPTQYDALEQARWNAEFPGGAAQRSGKLPPSADEMTVIDGYLEWRRRGNE